MLIFQNIFGMVKFFRKPSFWTLISLNSILQFYFSVTHKSHQELFGTRKVSEFEWFKVLDCSRELTTSVEVFR